MQAPQAEQPPAPASNNPFDPLAEIAGVPSDAGTPTPTTGTVAVVSPKDLNAHTSSGAATFDAPTASRVAHVKSVMGGAQPAGAQGYANPQHQQQQQQQQQSFHYHAHLQQQQQQRQQQQQLAAYNQAMQAQQVANAYNTAAQMQAYQTVMAQQQYMSVAPQNGQASHALVVHGQYNNNMPQQHNGYVNAFAAQQQQMMQLQLQQQRAAQSSALVPVMQVDASAAPSAQDFRVQRRKPTHVSEDDAAFRPLVDMLKNRVKNGASGASQSRT